MLNVLFRRNQALTLVLLRLSVQAMASLNTSSALSLHPHGCQHPLPQTPESAAPAHRPGFGQSRHPRSVSRSPSSLLSAVPIVTTYSSLLVSSSFISYHETSMPTSAQPSLADPIDGVLTWVRLCYVSRATPSGLSPWGTAPSCWSEMYRGPTSVSRIPWFRR